MHRKKYVGLGLLVIFALWTAAVRLVDVQAAGPEGAMVGFAALNQWFHHMTGVNWKLYNATDWLSVVPFGLMLGFALLGLKQWIERKQIRMVDRNLLCLGGMYAVMFVIYAAFEMFVVNCRPVLIKGALEASYPSSTTLLVICVISTAILQCKQRISHFIMRRFTTIALGAFGIFMLVGRVISGVHWITDIIGAALLGSGLVLLYADCAAK